MTNISDIAIFCGTGDAATIECSDADRADRLDDFLTDGGLDFTVAFDATKVRFFLTGADAAQIERLLIDFEQLDASSVGKKAAA